MSEWEPGRTTIDFLIGKGRLELVSPEGAVKHAAQILERASRRLITSRVGLESGDVEGAFVNAYDAYRMAAESLLAHQGMRATGGEGSHMTVEDSVAAQFSMDIEVFAKPTFERFRRTRHAAQYFDPEAPEIVSEDAEWAIATGKSGLAGARAVSGSGRLALFKR